MLSAYQLVDGVSTHPEVIRDFIDRKPAIIHQRLGVIDQRISISDEAFTDSNRLYWTIQAGPI